MSENEGWADFDNALARVFEAVRGARQSGTNPHLKSDYSTLADIYDACRPALAAESFSCPQLVTTSKEGGLHLVHITTQLRRAGHMIESTLALPVGGKGTVQDIGSAITYARRYGLSALLGIHPAEDDDGHAASAGREGHEDSLLMEQLRRVTGEVAGAFTDGDSQRAEAMVVKRAKLRVSNPPTLQQIRALIGAASSLLADQPNGGAAPT